MIFAYSGTLALSAALHAALKRDTLPETTVHESVCSALDCLYAMHPGREHAPRAMEIEEFLASPSQ